MSGKPFRFRLQNVLDVRSRAADQAEAALARAQSERAALAAQVAEAERAQAELSARYAQAQAGGLRSVRRHEGFRRDAGRSVAQARQLLAAADERLADAKRALRERRAESEALARLRARHAADHAAAQRKAEADFLDEQALRVHARRSY